MAKYSNFSTAVANLAGRRTEHHEKAKEWREGVAKEDAKRTRQRASRVDSNSSHCGSVTTTSCSRPVITRDVNESQKWSVNSITIDDSEFDHMGSSSSRNSRNRFRGSSRTQGYYDDQKTSLNSITIEEDPTMGSSSRNSHNRSLRVSKLRGSSSRSHHDDTKNFCDSVTIDEEEDERQERAYIDGSTWSVSSRGSVMKPAGQAVLDEMEQAKLDAKNQPKRRIGAKPTTESKEDGVFWIKDKSVKSYQEMKQKQHQKKKAGNFLHRPSMEDTRQSYQSMMKFTNPTPELY